MGPYVLSLLPVAVAYLLGSVPFGLLLAKTFCGIDPRLGGSGNVGATNVARLCGKKWGFLTLACDLGKGALSVGLACLMAMNVQGLCPYTVHAAGFAAIFGHMFPVFLRFKGGKGVATTVGVYLALAPCPFLVAAALCVLVIWRTGFVSAGSLVLVATLPVLLFLWGDTASATLALTTGALVVVAHRENIKRLLAGQEKPWTGKKQG